MRVRYTPRARGVLRMIIEYLVERNPVGAQNVKRAMERTVELIGQFPESGRRVSEHGVRVLPVGRYPYLIYWTVESGEAWIVHIRHAARRPWQGG
ncbi:MAG TPA: type II toxin-antitoxin system RelE/ParE family toxin [Xanthobacteraceae bacterium]|nr:type II toxin-antitoxin system RelE/ParE family toxin [Xanthobacteraceae bacterium]